MNDVFNKAKKAGEDFFEGTVKSLYPLLELDYEVKRDPRGNSIWMFYTDLKNVHYNINDDNEIIKRFKDRVIPLYFKDKNLSDVIELLGVNEDEFSDDELSMKTLDYFGEQKLIDSLIYSSLYYLGAHEAGHSADCPNCDKDRKGVNRAIYQGIKKRKLPGDSMGDIVRKAGNVNNLVTDVIVDTVWHGRSGARENLESLISNFDADSLFHETQSKLIDGVIPLFDIVTNSSADEGKFTSSSNPQLYGANEPNPMSLFYLTRALYADLFINDDSVRGEVKDYFMNKVPDKDKGRLTPIIKSFIKEVSDDNLKVMRVDRNKFLNSCDAKSNDRDYYINSLVKLFDDKRTRYNAIKGFAYEIADLIPKSPPPLNRNLSAGIGESGSDILDDLLPQPGDVDEGALSESEANEVIQSLANDPHGHVKRPDYKNKAIDEHYKRNAKPISLKNPEVRHEFVKKGVEIEWFLDEVTTVPVNEIGALDLTSINEFELSNGLRMLEPVQGADGRIAYFNYNHWVKRELDIVGYNPVMSGIELPKCLLFIEDTSGSMGGNNFINTGSSLDLLKHIEYGLMKDLSNLSDLLNSEVHVGSINFSNATFYSGLFNLKDVYASSSNKFKDVILSPQCGSTNLNASIIDSAKGDVDSLTGGGKNYYVVITDGQISYQGNIDYTINNILSNNDNHILLFQMGDYNNLIGDLLQGKPNGSVFNVKDINQIQTELTNIMIKKVSE